jgi:hypothetical protein
MDQCPIIIDNPVIPNNVKEEQPHTSQTEICDQYAVILRHHTYCRLLDSANYPIHVLNHMIWT